MHFKEKRMKMRNLKIKFSLLILKKVNLLIQNLKTKNQKIPKTIILKKIILQNQYNLLFDELNSVKE